MSVQYKNMNGVSYLPLSVATAYHTVDICEVEVSLLEDSNSRFWIIYLHGGGWSDPDIQANTGHGIFEGLLNADAKDLSHIAGFAAINYRLSGNLSRGRGARHPDHIQDVKCALRFLNARYQFQDRYILVGHSAGATMAFQIAMEPALRSLDSETGAFKKPLAILGASGIYDFHQLLASVWSIPDYRKEYQDMLENAFGPSNIVNAEEGLEPSDDQWNLASPAKASSYGSSWRNARVAMLVHSRNDELVPLKQSEQLAAVLKSSLGSEAVCCTRFDFIGSHDDVWRQPNDIVRFILELIRMLVESSSNDLPL